MGDSSSDDRGGSDGRDQAAGTDGQQPERPGPDVGTRTLPSAQAPAEPGKRRYGRRRQRQPGGGEPEPSPEPPAADGAGAEEPARAPERPLDKTLPEGRSPAVAEAAREALAAVSAPEPEPCSTTAASEDAESQTILAKIEPLVQKGDWEGVCGLLGPPERAEKLPAKLALLYAAARAEAGGAESMTDANFMAIRSVAALLGVSPESRTALVVAKRIMRRSPAAWGRRPAPKAPLRMALVIIALTLGIVGGWLAGPNGIRLKEIIQAIFPEPAH
ncbi:MAG: hypothetical protein HY744_25265 [Deltaproteobacteria bacterium]|nr:hypothetical protein [Deltaproteobacteria bacterium]